MTYIHHTFCIAHVYMHKCTPVSTCRHRNCTGIDHLAKLVIQVLKRVYWTAVLEATQTKRTEITGLGFRGLGFWLSLPG